MSGFYEDIASTVLELMTEFGQRVTVQQQGPKTTNANGVTVPSAPVGMTTVGLLFDYAYRMYGNESIKGELINTADKQLYIAPTPVAPKVQDKVLVAGSIWAIVNIKQVNPAGVPVLYELWLKR